MLNLLHEVMFKLPESLSKDLLGYRVFERTEIVLEFIVWTTVAVRSAVYPCVRVLMEQEGQ